MGRIRSGQPVSGQVAANRRAYAAGVDGDLTDPRIIVFRAPVRPCIVTNHGATDEILVKVNVETTGTVSETFATPNRGHFVIPPKVTLADAAKDPPEGGECWVDVSLGGQLLVHSVSIATVNGDLDDVSVVGWKD